MLYLTLTLEYLRDISSSTYPQTELLSLQTCPACSLPHLSLLRISIVLFFQSFRPKILELLWIFPLVAYPSKVWSLLSTYVQNLTTSLATIMTIPIPATTLAPWSLLSNSWSFKNFWKLKSNNFSAQTLQGLSLCAEGKPCPLNDLHILQTLPGFISYHPLLLLHQQSPLPTARNALSP